MPTSKVYFTDLRTQIGVSQLDKLEKLIRAAGIGDIDFDHKMTAIKIHFGEPGNLTYLRPNYAKRVADVIKSLGGLPFLTDCNTLYPGRPCVNRRCPRGCRSGWCSDGRGPAPPGGCAHPRRSGASG